MRTIKGALLDMDGIMYDTEHLSTVVWTEVSQLYNRPLTQEQILSFRGSNKYDNCKKYLKWYPDDEDLYWEMRVERYRRFNEYIAKNGVPLKPGLYELLDALKERNIPICVATGTARDMAELYWDETGVRPYLAASVCGGEVEKSKPDPEVFETAAAKLGLDPKDCLVLEDSPNGVRAAHAAGCYTVMIPDETQPDDELLPLCDKVLPSLLDVIGLL